MAGQRLSLVLALFPVLTLPLPTFAGNLSGLVVSVLDGDTIEVLHNNRAERIRLNGIDCPEKLYPVVLNAGS